VLAFITSFNQVPVSLFLTGPGVSTLPIEMIAYMEDELRPVDRGAVDAARSVHDRRRRGDREAAGDLEVRMNDARPPPNAFAPPRGAGAQRLGGQMSELKLEGLTIAYGRRRARRRRCRGSTSRAERPARIAARALGLRQDDDDARWAGLLPPVAGRIVLGGDDITKLPSAQDATFGLVFQSYALFPHLSLFENVASGGGCGRVADAELKQRVDEALAAVGLAEFAARLPAQLSRWPADSAWRWACDGDPAAAARCSTSRCPNLDAALRLRCAPRCGGCSAPRVSRCCT